MKCASIRYPVAFAVSFMLLVTCAAACRSSVPNPLTAETARLRALAAAGDETALAQALDRSTVAIPAGEFIMGSETGRDDERPAHRVYLDAYELDRFEVTNAQYRRFLLATGSRPPEYWTGITYPAGQADYPVVGVSWDYADAYCRWAGKRLPTEAEWEKACRGADGRVYPWGDAWAPSLANVDAVGWRSGTATQDAVAETVWEAAWRRLALPPGSAGPTLQPVGSHLDGASPYGILDMVGNASEWVADWYNWSDYAKLPARNPLVTGPPWNRCLRGSPWYDPVGTPAWTQTLSRCAARNSAHEVSDPRVGFRCARSGRPNKQCSDYEHLTQTSKPESSSNRRGGPMSTETVRMTQTVHTPAAEVYRAFTRSLALREWMCDGAVMDARPGGRLYVWWHSSYYAMGEFTALDPERRVAFTWQGRGEPGATQVAVVLTPSGDGVEVTLTHEGFGAGDAWHKARRASQDGWTQGMENLKSVLETGQDLRYVLRPMLGIYVDEFNADIAARLGVPVGEGTRLGDVVEGLGAEQAGLQRDDVIVSLAGRPTNDYPGLVAALGSHRACDRVDVAFYRGGERRTTEMALSRRPIPEVPATPAELTAAVRQANASAFAELARSLEGVSDDRAAHRPAPGEWNTLEVLAHLIAHEREQQTWITDLLCDDERWSDRFENTEVVPARIAAIARAYPRLADMTEALRRSQDETADMLAALPAELVAHQGTYWRLGRSMLEGVQPPNHVQEHTAQIRAAIAAP